MAVTKGVDKWKAKKWFNIYPPELLGSNPIGEMPASEDKNVIGRIIKVNMSWITQKPAHSFIVVGLKVNEVSGNAANTSIKYLEQTYSYLHSLVQRHSSTIYTINKLNDKEGKSFVLKLLVTTEGKATTPKEKAIRSQLGAFAKEYAAGKDRGEFVKDVVEGTFQKEGIKKVHNIAAISRLELKRMEL